MADGWKGSTRKYRLPKDWHKIRLVILERDGHRCHVCGRAGADAVDHVVPGDNHDLSNLKAIHHNVYPYCHRKKTAADRPKMNREPERHPGLKW